MIWVSQSPTRRIKRKFAVVEIGGIGSPRNCRFPKNVGGGNCVGWEVSAAGCEISQDLAWGDKDE
jgi:hypothetical protein